ncbi:hypothetical protein [Deinococcus sp.]|uniref:hypothetical protein n=1 Tax=Deinococcus sp. TaxID=47478 RepID=UPI0025E8B6DF|nr:hypothetical protein [Deinococcus sp.]
MADVPFTHTPPNESLWPARIAILAIIALQVLLNERLTAGPNWLVPALEAGLLIPLSALRRAQHRRGVGPAELGQGWLPSHGAMRVLAFVLIAILNLANLASLALLVYSLLHGSKATGRLLLIGALNIWFTNIIVYALWYWELDRGGPFKRQTGSERGPDLLFPQMSMAAGPGGWCPSFLDYLFVSFTNATAFSPTDTLPLTPNVKVLMMIQSATSLLTIALVASRAVNILA